MSAEPHDEHARPVGALYTAVLFIVTILSGSYFIMALKFCDQTSAIGLGTEPHLFSHPLFQPIGKFFGSALWFVAYYAWKRFSRAARRRQELDDLGPHSRQVDYTPEESQSESESDSDEWFVSGQVGSRDRVSEPGYARPGSQHRSSQERPEFSNWLFVMPAALDWFGSSMAYVGMMFTTASTFQLLRDCALLIFLVLLGLCFYGKLLKVWQGAGMFILLIGAVLVFFSSVLSPASTALELAPEPLLGNTLVIVSQFFVATHLLVEQKLVREYNVSPLLIVGWQGVFGFLITVVMQVIYYFLPGKTYGGRLENALDAIMQISHSPQLTLFFFSGALSLGVFYFCGITITRLFSATTRAVVDVNRSLVVLIFSVAIGWETVMPLKVCGVVFVLFGFLVYLDVFHCCSPRRSRDESPAEQSQNDQGTDREQQRLMRASPLTIPQSNNTYTGQQIYASFSPQGQIIDDHGFVAIRKAPVVSQPWREPAIGYFTSLRQDEKNGAISAKAANSFANEFFASGGVASNNKFSPPSNRSVSFVANISPTISTLSTSSNASPIGSPANAATANLLPKLSPEAKKQV